MGSCAEGFEPPFCVFFTKGGALLRKGLMLFLIGIALGLFFFPFQPVLSFTETKTKQPIKHYIPLTHDHSFMMRYTHSIHRSDVLEYYEMTADQRIQLSKMIYEHVAIGLPGYAEEGQTLQRLDGKYHLTFDQQPTLTDFVLHIGDIDLDLTITYVGKEYDLKAHLERGRAYTCKVERLSLFQQWKGVHMK